MKGYCVALFFFVSGALVHAQDAKIEWTTELSKMKAPDAPVSGTVKGASFKADSAKHAITGAVTLKQGTDVIGDANVILFLKVKKADDLAGKKFEVESTGNAQTRPHVHINRRPSPNELPKGEAFIEGYAMRLEFGEKKDGKIPAKIYLCISDSGKSVIAGTFTIEAK